VITTVGEREWAPGFPLDVYGTLAVHRRGRGDPAYQVTRDGAVWRTSYTPDGPGTLRVVPAGAVVRAAAWGPGAGWLLEQVPAMLGGFDDPSALRPMHEAVRVAVAARPGVRLGRAGRVFEALVPAVLEQKVVGQEAFRAWRYLLRKYGEPAPGGARVPEGMRVPPPPAVWIRIPSWEWHRSGAEAVRARTIMNAARVAARLEEDPAEERLRSLPGIGIWTAAEIRQRAVGDPDAISVGDYHLSGQVGWALEGRKVDDARMLELLAPYEGQRHRVSMLLATSGGGPPRRGPRMSVRDYRHF